MEKQTLKDVIYGGIAELMNNENYFYKSFHSSYSSWSSRGKDAIVDFITKVSLEILEIEDQELNRRAKQQVLKGLKGDVSEN